MKHYPKGHLKPPFKLSAEQVRLAGREVSIIIPFETTIRDIRGKLKIVKGTKAINRKVTPVVKSSRFFARKMFHELKKKGY